MRRFLCILILGIVGSSGTSQALVDGEGSSTHDGEVTVGVVVSSPGDGTAGSAGATRPLIEYLLSWSVDPTPAQTGSLNGLCTVPGPAGTPVFGFQYHLVGRDATGAIVDDRFQCVAFPNGDATQRPPEPAIPAVPTFGEAWNSVQLPAPVVTLDPATRGITGLDTRISTSGPTTIVITATIRGYTITGTATLDHYAISVDGQPPTNAANGHYTFETKGNHTIAVSAVWHGTAAITGPDLPGGLPVIDLGNATITATRNYPVNEIRSVLQP
jgi:hypothetical protein